MRDVSPVLIVYSCIGSNTRPVHEVAYFKWFSLYHSKAGFQKCPSGSRVIDSEDKRVFGTDFRDRHLVAWHPSMPASQETVGPAHCGPYHARVQNSELSFMLS